MRTFFRNNGLSLALLVLFLGSFAGQALAGYREYSSRQREHGLPAGPLLEYLGSGAFLEATFENWESEFLQMTIYVWLTAFLYQRGSAESKDPEKQEAVDEDPRRHAEDKHAPWPVRRGGIVLRLYEHSLSIALALLFIISFGLHLFGSAKEQCHEQVLHGEACQAMWKYLTGATFWFQSFQNWQSEFLSIAVLVVFSIFLRQRGSPESKPVHVPHHSTGKD